MKTLYMCFHVQLDSLQSVYSIKLVWKFTTFRPSWKNGNMSGPILTVFIIISYKLLKTELIPIMRRTIIVISFNNEIPLVSYRKMNFEG